MKNLLCACAFFLLSFLAFSQTTKIKADKYPSLLWEISGKKGSRPSYLFGTMHVSNKMAFHLSDSFYRGLRNAEIVALETNPATWQEDFSRYDLDGQGWRYRSNRSAEQGGNMAPQDFMTIHSLKFLPFEKTLEAALYSSPAMLNNFLYRSHANAGSDFEEDTYLDLHIFQIGKKLGKKLCGVEDFHGSMRLVKEAYSDAAKEKKGKQSFDYDNSFSYAHMEEAYRTGNLDLLDTINKVNSQSAAFDEKFLYWRNEIQAASIDSILKTGATLFAGVGAAHLPGQRGVIEILRALGYKLRPIKMTERDSHHRENIERIRVPVQFSRQVADDGFYSVKVPGKLYAFGQAYSGLQMKQFADMANGSYYMVSRVLTRSALQGQTEQQVRRKLDSVLYENVPGKILFKQPVLKNGYRGYDITNRTRRGDLQRYQIFITPFEVLLFKMSGTGDYVKLGTEAEQFFSSIQLKEPKTEWQKWGPSFGDFSAEWPHLPLPFRADNTSFTAFDGVSKTAFEVIRTDVHHHGFLEEDSFDLSLMEESFASSECIARNLFKKWTKQGGYPALEARYKYKDSTLAFVRFIIRGPHYYTLAAVAKEENRDVERFLSSFAFLPYRYGEARLQTDTIVRFAVQTSVALDSPNKLSLYPNEMAMADDGENNDDSLVENGTFASRTIYHDLTGEKIHVSYFRHSPYFFSKGTLPVTDSVAFKKEWVVRKKTAGPNYKGMTVTSYELGHTNSSRLLKGKSFIKDGMGYSIETQTDTLSGGSELINRFLNSFTPLDLLADMAVTTKKSTLFFSQFFSADSLLHEKAIKNIEQVEMDTADFIPLQQAIASLSWKEKNYLPVKKQLIGKLAVMPGIQGADYLKTLYYSAGDTAELQYTALETLLAQRTAYAYQTFAEILQDDPPVLDMSFSASDYTTPFRQNGGKREASIGRMQIGYFFDNMRDSLALTAGIFKQLLPLISVDDYEQPLIELLRLLVDSSLISPSDYETFLPKFLLEAKQGLKKQLIQEKTKSIEKAKTEDGNELYEPKNRLNRDDGNHQLTLYTTLLLPFWDKHPQVEQLTTQLLQSNDSRLRYNTALLLLRKNRPVSDSVLNTFARMDEFRYELYTDLEKWQQLKRFPAAYKTQLELAKSQLASLQTYDRPDTLVFLQRVTVQADGQEGLVYIFKYKEKKEDNTWKLATAGLFPNEDKALLLDEDKRFEEAFDLTALTGLKLSTEETLDAQIESIRKKLQYSLRKSSRQYYEERDYDELDYLPMRN